MYLVRTVNNRVLQRTNSSRVLSRTSTSRVLQRVIGNLSVTVSSGTSAPQTGSGSPLNVVTPTATGGFYRDTDTYGSLWYATGSTSADWWELVRNY